MTTCVRTQGRRSSADYPGNPRKTGLFALVIVVARETTNLGVRGSNPFGRAISLFNILMLLTFKTSTISPNICPTDSAGGSAVASAEIFVYRSTVLTLSKSIIQIVSKIERRFEDQTGEPRSDPV